MKELKKAQEESAKVREEAKKDYDKVIAAETAKLKAAEKASKEQVEIMQKAPKKAQVAG